MKPDGEMNGVIWRLVGSVKMHAIISSECIREVCLCDLCMSVKFHFNLRIYLPFLNKFFVFEFSCGSSRIDRCVFSRLIFDNVGFFLETIFIAHPKNRWSKCNCYIRQSVAAVLN